MSNDKYFNTSPLLYFLDFSSQDEIEISAGWLLLYIQLFTYNSY